MDLNEVGNVSLSFNRWYASATAPIPDKYKILITLLFFTVIIVIYAIVVWKLSKFLSKREILSLNLFKYNKISHEFISKIYASVLFIIEYIIITPVMVIIWFGFFSIFLILLSKGISTDQILLISAAMVAAIRLCSYLNGELSQDLAKLFPLNALVIVLLEPNIVSLNAIITRLIQIPSLFDKILIFVLFVVALEVILRLIFTLIDFWKSEEKKEEIPKGAFPRAKIVKVEKRR